MDVAPFAAEIQRIAPGLFPASVTLLGEGFHSRAFLVGDDYLFRFPRSADEAGPRAAASLEVEVALLPKLAPRVGVPIPRFEYVGRRLANGLPFVGYRLLRGAELTPERFNSLPGAAKDRILAQLADFLRALRAFPIEEALACGVPRDDFRANAIEHHARARADVFPLVDASVQRHIEHLFTQYLGDAANFADPPVLLHADLAPEHVLLTDDRRGLAGILDFGDVSIGDPDYDLAYPFWAGFAVDLLRHLPHPDPPRLTRKLHFFIAREVIDDIFMGLDRSDPALVRARLATLNDHARAGYGLADDEPI